MPSVQGEAQEQGTTGEVPGAAHDLAAGEGPSAGADERGPPDHGQEGDRPGKGRFRRAGGPGRRRIPPRDPTTLGPDEPMTAEEAGEYLRISAWSAYQLVARGVGVKRPGIGVRFTRRQLDDYLAHGLLRKRSERRR